MNAPIWTGTDDMWRFLRHRFRKSSFSPVHTWNEAFSKRCVSKRLHFWMRFRNSPFSSTFSGALVRMRPEDDLPKNNALWQLFCFSSYAVSLQCPVCIAHDRYTCTQASNHRLERCRSNQNLCVTYVFLSFDGETYSFDRRCSNDKIFNRMWELCYGDVTGPKPEGNCFLAKCETDGCKAQVNTSQRKK